MKPQILTNLIPEVYQEELKQTVEEIPFYYSSSIGYNQTSLPTAGIKFLDNIGFSHGLVIEGQQDSMYWGLFRPLLYFFTQKTGVVVKNVIRVRLRLTFQHPDRNEYLFNKPHTDLFEFDQPYKTLVYYINDSDGDTFIFDKFFNKSEDLDNALKDIDKKIILQNTPKQGDAIYFDGHQYHAGNSPIKYKHRYVINFDFTV